MIGKVPWEPKIRRAWWASHYNSSRGLRTSTTDFITIDPSNKNYVLEVLEVFAAIGTEGSIAYCTADTSIIAPSLPMSSSFFSLLGW